MVRRSSTLVSLVGIRPSAHPRPPRNNRMRYARDVRIQRAGPPSMSMTRPIAAPTGPSDLAAESVPEPLPPPAEREPGGNGGAWQPDGTGESLYRCVLQLRSSQRNCQRESPLILLRFRGRGDGHIIDAGSPPRSRWD